MMNKTKRTKIVCTIGPASWDPAVLTEMIKNGMNVARVNGAFADVAELERVENLIRGISNDVALMLDIKGTEVRLNRFGEPFDVAIDEIVEIGNSDQHRIFPATYPNLYQDLEIGQHMLFDDGNVEMVVVEITSDGIIKGKVIRPGKFKEGKSINTPGAKLKNPPLTEKDKEQMEFVRERGWEFVAASFIRDKDDAQLVYSLLKGYATKLIAKIEDVHGVTNIDEIIPEVDGVMVARGDMAVEMPFEKIPMIQKDLIFKCNMAGKPVIVATQMLESMI
jgi:pyruvate kinase